nr:immunoglobulin light chain junction region [Macaca mulatta]MPN91880.1 immunoglobulin light chain junction region [Macaca mulatta]MPN92896.1 immunoglobulin light chain junction region [Macaca mulatta]MPN95116.1 immunoglobulin light chain junction region [Macaca mulatta]MPN95338.1 immunoglobulin light chain junction region [Macaca mulatta]
CQQHSKWPQRTF